MTLTTYKPYTPHQMALSAALSGNAPLFEALLNSTDVQPGDLYFFRGPVNDYEFNTYFLLYEVAARGHVDLLRLLLTTYKYTPSADTMYHARIRAEQKIQEQARQTFQTQFPKLLFMDTNGGLGAYAAPLPNMYRLPNGEVQRLVPFVTDLHRQTTVRVRGHKKDIRRLLTCQRRTAKLLEGQTIDEEALQAYAQTLRFSFFNDQIPIKNALFDTEFKRRKTSDRLVEVRQHLSEAKTLLEQYTAILNLFQELNLAMPSPYACEEVAHSA